MNDRVFGEWRRTKVCSWLSRNCRNNATKPIQLQSLKARELEVPSLEPSTPAFQLVLIEIDFPGGHTAGVTPVPIPNTEVKPRRADDTARVTVWERRSLPGLLSLRKELSKTARCAASATGRFCFWRCNIYYSRRQLAVINASVYNVRLSYSPNESGSKIDDNFCDFAGQNEEKSIGSRRGVDRATRGQRHARSREAGNGANRLPFP